MGSPSLEAKGLVLCVVSMVAWSCLSLVAQGSVFNKDFDINWGDGCAKILDSGRLLALFLNKDSGSGFQSKNQYLFGKVDMQIKLVPGNSAITITSYYLNWDGASWDEIDFEFLGNLSGDPCVMHTNVYTQGKDLLWTTHPSGGSGTWSPGAWPSQRASVTKVFSIHSTLWNADDWATRRGLVKTDWTQAPFMASYRNFGAEACVWASGSSSCGPMGQPVWFTAKMDADRQVKMKSVV